MTLMTRLCVFALIALAAACGGPASEARKAQTSAAIDADAGGAAVNVETLAEGLVNP